MEAVRRYMILHKEYTDCIASFQLKNDTEPLAQCTECIAPDFKEPGL